ncbi:MAG TPA: dTMP kinase [Tissierellia bacterium]|nr:dTMP kinase [Tissierellia bacterium]
MKGYWISFEGGEGSGKTTLIELLREALIKQGQDVVVTREPGGVRIAEQIREIILRLDNTEMDAITEALLFAASRRQHLVEKVLPALDQGKVVLMDRYVDSSIAYQGYARELGMDEIRQLNDFAIQGALPDITFWIDLDPAIGLSRIATSGRKVNRLDKEAKRFHERVREGYRRISQTTDRLVAIDGDQLPEKIVEQIMKRIEIK